MSVLLEPSDKPGMLVFRSLETVWAWLRSANAILNDKGLGMPIDLKKLEFTDYDGYWYDVRRLRALLSEIFGGVTWDRPRVLELVRRTWRAKVHAEAALMGDACSEVGFHLKLKFSSSTDCLV